MTRPHLKDAVIEAARMDSDKVADICFQKGLRTGTQAERDRICAMLRNGELTEAAAMLLQPALAEMPIFDSVKRNATAVALVLSRLIENGATAGTPPAAGPTPEHS